MKKLLFLALILLLAACSSNTNADETDTYKTSNGKITNDKLLINLAVRAETIVEKYDEIDNVSIDEEDITAEKLSDSKETETGKIYKNVYSIDGKYTWKEKKYDFEWVVSFKDNDVDSSGSVLQYTSEMGKNQLNIERKPVN